MITRHVCDRCKNEVTSFLKMQTEQVSASGIGVRGSYLLCDKCAEDFTDRFIDGYGHEANEVKEERENTSTKKQPVVYRDFGDDTDDHSAWVCPQCRSKYVFWIGSGQDPVRVCYADLVFTTQVNIPRSYFRSGEDVPFECPTCKRLLYIPNSIVEEVNKK